MALVPGIRDATDADTAFVMSAWLRSARGAGDHAVMREDDFYRAYRPVAEARLSRSRALVAHWPDDPTLHLGFIVFENRLLHFVYVKQAFRRVGIAKALLRAAFPAGLSEATSTARPKRGVLPKHLRFNPFAA